MTRLGVLSGLFVVLLATANCSKSNGNNNGTPDVALAVQTDPATGVVMAPSIGPFNLKVTITSTMPANGVKIDVSAKKDDGTNGTPYFTTTTNTTTAVTNFSITNTPSNVQGLVEIKVTSLSQSSNQWTGSYRYSRK